MKNYFVIIIFHVIISGLSSEKEEIIMKRILNNIYYICRNLRNGFISNSLLIASNVVLMHNWWTARILTFLIKFNNE